MAADPSAYAALGLDAGADPADVERAYKRLIKRYHPDREGGDAGRAAEINRAYRELRLSAGRKEALDLDQDDAFEVRRNRWTGAALAFGGFIVALLLATGPLSALVESRSGTARLVKGDPQTANGEDAMDQPLSVEILDEAIRDAVQMTRSADEVALAAASRDCHRGLREERQIWQLDRCAAFDDAVVQLQDRDPLRNRGPFSQLEVTGRQMSGATLFSNDSLAIDNRLDRIRLHVELALAPGAAAAAEVAAAD